MIPALTLIEDQLSFYNVRRSGNSYNAATLLAAIDDLDNTECVAYLPKGLEDSQTIWLIDQSVIVPENISVLIPCGVLLNIVAGITLTFEGPCFNQCPNWYYGDGQVILKSKSAINSQSYSDFFDAFVVSGGLHGLSPTCYSPNFYTEAYVSNGQYVLEPQTSIRYGDLGANCLSDTVWVVISSLTTPTIPGTNFINVPGSHYYIDYASTSRPSLPQDSAYLMEVILYNDQITQVNDLRVLDASSGLLDRVLPQIWAPELGPGIFTYSAHVGEYLRYGRMIQIYGNIQIGSIDPSNTGNVSIINLPFADAMRIVGGITFHLIEGITPGEGPATYSALIFPGNKVFQLTELITSRPSKAVDASRIKVGCTMIFSGSYIVYPEEV